MRNLFKEVMIVLATFIVVASLLILPLSVHAAPKAASQAECNFLTDMAITAQALAKQGLPVDVQRQILTRIYLPEAAISGANPELIKHLRAMLEAVLASSGNYVKLGDGAYAEQLGTACLEKGGDMDSVLGVGV